ncbi:heterokaryon incompatibility protein-domain-containing protein [Echria macrotheca]|uniref:Heterokaryon incompatibility protein-domain-containing protein n=1 Tax=Echria macrotheca TaxID=438768 RepID=A0AAJ0F611_9PEZI|nr:heterokaryon incompatibility protein-domain-containing protein [Echria macrotheca]
MRLLNSRSWRMKEFIIDDEIPPYAILSHTWGDEEVTFRDWDRLPRDEVKSMKGWGKINYCRKQAACNGYDWVWVDTCCIDKSSSAELSEAINSMFRWYKNAEICYVYLADVEKTADWQEMRRRISASRWFTRGWTLQELLAPTTACFYCTDWSVLGTRAELVDVISSVTRIHRKYLQGENVHRASVAQRMSWASLRNTSRVEDIAYCLLGIFDINMPLIYGEGHKAFQRLQHMIMQSYSSDHSLFAWGTISENSSLEYLSDAEYRDTTKTIAWKAPADRPESAKLSGLFAASPRDFKDSHSIVPSRWASLFYRDPGIRATLPMLMSHSTVRLELPHLPSSLTTYYWDDPDFAQVRNIRLLALLCNLEGSEGDFMTLTVVDCDHYLYARTREVVVSETSLTFAQLSQRKDEVCIGLPSYQLQHREIVFRRWAYPPKCTMSFFGLAKCNINYSNGIVSGISERDGKLFALQCRRAQTQGPPRGCEILFSRESNEIDSSISIGLIPFSAIEGVDTAEGNDGWRRDRTLREADPSSARTMKCPLDQWTTRAPAPFGIVYVQVERVSFGSDGSYVDVVDLIFKPEQLKH